jgi:hypothetical protein
VVTDTAGTERGTLLILNLGADAPDAAGGTPRLRHLNGVLILGARPAAGAMPPLP